MTAQCPNCLGRGCLRCWPPHLIIEKQTDTIERLTRERDEANNRLRSLLARIHRDGGHYTSTHGVEKAVEDADMIVANYHPIVDCTIPRMTKELDEARAERDNTDANNLTMARLLAGVANAIKGEPRPGYLHSWHDLPELTATLTSDRDHLAEQVRVLQNEVLAGRECWIITNVSYVVKSECVDRLADARAATEAAKALGEAR
jgi:hypothetical protein